jgi:hypothetical protein
MPDEIIKLDLDTARRLTQSIQDDIARGRFSLGNDQVFIVDPAGERSDLARTLRETLPFVDLDAGGLKVLDLDFHGQSVHFTIVPRGQLPNGHDEFGGSIGLRVTW